MQKEILSVYGKQKKVSLDFKDTVSKTKQSFADETNINKIIERFNKTGQLPNLIKQDPKYGDYSNPQTYQESLNTIHLANEQFESLSAKVRNKFQNDPIKLLEFVSDPKNLEEMYNLGLAIRPAPKAESDLIKASSTSKAGNNQVSGTETNKQEK